MEKQIIDHNNDVPTHHRDVSDIKFDKTGFVNNCILCLLKIKFDIKLKV